MRLTNKSIIVTGAGSGIGEGIAKRLAAEGGKIVVNDLNPAGGERVTAEIKAAGGTALFVKADVTKDADFKRLVDAAVAAHGGLDSVVNNAGWTHRKKPMLDVTEEEFDRCFNVNVKSIVMCARHAIPQFRAQGKARGGALINIASTAGVRPRPGLNVYNASKGAAILLSKSMALEYGPDNVRVNCVNPVFNPDTALSADFAGGEITPEARAMFMASIPLGRFSTALDVANAVLFLASDEGAFVSGVNLEVDGARCA